MTINHEVFYDNICFPLYTKVYSHAASLTANSVYQTLAHLTVLMAELHFTHSVKEGWKKSLLDLVENGRYLLCAALTAAALPPVPQTVAAGAVLAGLDVLF